MQKKARSYLDHFLTFLNASPTAWHATLQLEKLCQENGFEQLLEGEKWHLQPGGRYFACRHGSTFAAFVVPLSRPLSAHIVAAHSDSPGLKLKPQAEYRRGNMVMLGTEIYGSPLLTSWLNRDLGIAGQIAYLQKDGTVGQALVNLKNRPLVIPQLAIHLDRNVNEQGPLLNKQEHLTVLAALSDTELDGERSSYLEMMLQEEIPFETLLAHDLFLYPLQPPSYMGRDQEMIAGYRLDNLCSAYAAAQALMHTPQADTDKIKLVVCWNHEETGSETAEGAASPFLPNLLERILLALNEDREAYLRLLAMSTCISVDLGHALHPNYMEKHDPYHRPLLNHGIILKINAQQRYASNAMTSAAVAALCAKKGIPLQWFVVRSDMPCGSTIGPITAALTGIPTVDIGIPQLSMHSCRELVGAHDCVMLFKFLHEALS